MKSKVFTIIKVLVLLDVLVFFASFLQQLVFHVFGPLTPIALIAVGVWGWRKFKRSQKDTK